MKLINFIYYTLFYHFLWLFFQLFPNHSLFNTIRGKVIGNLFFKSCGKSFLMARGVTLVMCKNMEVGDNVYIAHDCWVNATGGLSISDGVIISPKVVIATTKHLYFDGSVQLRSSVNKPMLIGKGSWVCSNTTLAMGANVGVGVIISANSFLVKSTDNYKLYGGNPALPLKDLI